MAAAFLAAINDSSLPSSLSGFEYAKLLLATKFPAGAFFLS